MRRIDSSWRACEFDDGATWIGTRVTFTIRRSRADPEFAGIAIAGILVLAILARPMRFDDPPRKLSCSSLADVACRAGVRAAGRREHRREADGRCRRQGRGRGDPAAEPQTIEDQVRLCEVEAPPFKEAKRAEVYARMFREARPAERAHRQGRQRARRSARRAAAPAAGVQRASRHRVSRRHRRQGQARGQRPARPRHRRRLPRPGRGARGRFAR